MSVPDLINGCYELFGAPFITLSLIKVLKDKEVKGVNWIHVLYFTTWGIWNLYYYPHLNQWASFFGGLAIVVTNTLWLLAILYYSRIQKCQT